MMPRAIGKRDLPVLLTYQALATQALGENTIEILHKILGHSGDQINELLDKNIVRVIK